MAEERWSEGLKGPEDLDTEGCMELVGAVIAGAVRSWRMAGLMLKANIKNAEAKGKRQAAENFFLSTWMQALSGLNGRALLEELKKEEERGW